MADLARPESSLSRAISRCPRAQVLPAAPQRFSGFGPGSGREGFCYTGEDNRYAPVAQLDRAFASGAKGRTFESCRAYHPFFNRRRYANNGGGPRSQDLLRTQYLRALKYPAFKRRRPADRDPIIQPGDQLQKPPRSAPLANPYLDWSSARLRTWPPFARRSRIALMTIASEWRTI